MLFTMYNIYTKKSNIIKRYIEDQKEIYGRKTAQISNYFFRTFFEQAIECTVADAYENFIELECENNVFYENINKLNPERGRRLFKMTAIYYTIKVIRKKRREINAEDFRQALFFVFDFNENEKRLYDLLYTCNVKYESQFSDLFAKAFAKYIFSIDNCSMFTLAFIENFCYNSYSCFMASFTKYLSLNLRLKKAAN